MSTWDEICLFSFLFFGQWYKILVPTFSSFGTYDENGIEINLHPVACLHFSH